MKSLVLFFFFFFLVFVNFVSSASSNNRKTGKIIFKEDFNVFDLSVWKHEITMGGGGNWEFEFYTNNRSNSYVSNGILYIYPTLTSELIGENNVLNGYTMDIWGSEPADLCTGNAFYGCSRASQGGDIINPIQSARIRTANSFSFQYGSVEVRAKLPRGDWLWPAIWLLPTYNSYGEWPASGEIDIVESRGNTDYPGGVNSVSSTLHWGPFDPIDGYKLTTNNFTLSSGDFADDFHIFGLEWNETCMYTWLDEPSQIIMKVDITESFWEKGGWGTSYNNPWNGRGNNAPFDQRFFFIFNLAVGGVNGYFPDGVGGKPWQDASQVASAEFWSAQGQWYPTWNGVNASLQIDYIYVYAPQNTTSRLSRPIRYYSK